MISLAVPEMQIAPFNVPDTAAAPLVRPPWPDEIPRLRHYLPEAFLFDDKPALFVGVAGSAERLVAVGALVRRPVPAPDDGPAALLYLRTREGEQQVAWIKSLARAALDYACRHGIRRICAGQTFAEESPVASALVETGFTPESITEVHVVDSRATLERLRRVYLRLRERGAIPVGARLNTLLPGLVQPVRQFLRAHLPGSASNLAAETAGYKPENSLVLLVRGEVKGALLSRRDGATAFVGLRVVAPELRGGIGWANLLLLYGSLEATVHNGLKESHFEFNPGHHVDTSQFARLSDARLVGRRVLLARNTVENA